MSPEYKKDLLERIKEVECKDGVSPDDWDKVHPNLLIVADAVISYCDSYNLPLKITSIIRGRIPGKSKTDTHAEGRAFDVSLIGWTDSDARDCAHVINHKLNIGAISKKDMEEREAVFEDGISAGTARHLHFQVRA